jgi:hypothetical protein
MRVDSTYISLHRDQVVFLYLTIYLIFTTVPEPITGWSKPKCTHGNFQLFSHMVDTNYFAVLHVSCDSKTFSPL